MAQWTIDLGRYARDKKVEIREVRRAYAFALYASIVRMTPWDTGRARGNWNVSVGKPDDRVSDTKRKTPAGRSAMPEPEGDESIFITNNLPYIETLEYGGYPKTVKRGTYVKGTGGKKGHYEVRSKGGFSKKAPQGMVGVTLANNENIFNAAVRSVRR